MHSQARDVKRPLPRAGASAAAEEDERRHRDSAAAITSSAGPDGWTGRGFAHPHFL
jgi:hypothetical protein